MYRRILPVVCTTALLLGLATGAGAGNGAPSGPHYNLNIIGVSKGKTADMTNSDGHSLFVPLQGQCKINLQQGAFQVTANRALFANLRDSSANELGIAGSPLRVDPVGTNRRERLPARFRGQRRRLACRMRTLQP